MDWTACGVELPGSAGPEGHLAIWATALEEGPRAPAVINLLLDRSGSMKGAPLAAAVEAVQQFVEMAGAEDYLGLVVFDALAEQRVPLVPMDVAGKRRMIQALHQLRPGSGTALHQALELGAKALQRLLVPGRRPKLLVLTDGEPSVGPDTEAAFERLGVKLAQSGVSVHALGLARHYIAEILAGITLPSGNAFEHVDGPDGLSVAMGSLAALLFGEVATHATVRVRPTGFRAIASRHSYQAHVEDDALVVFLGSMSRRLTRSVLLSGQLTGAGWGAEIEVSSMQNGEQRREQIPLHKVEVDSTQGRFIRGLGLELQLVSAETASWLSLSRKDNSRSEALLEEAEKALRELKGLKAAAIRVRRHHERLKDLRAAVERGEGDLPLLIRRAKSARATAHVSQVIPLHPERIKR